MPGYQQNELTVVKLSWTVAFGGVTVFAEMQYEQVAMNGGWLAVSWIAALPTLLPCSRGLSRRRLATQALTTILDLA